MFFLDRWVKRTKRIGALWASLRRQNLFRTPLMHLISGRKFLIFKGKPPQSWRYEAQMDIIAVERLSLLSFSLSFQIAYHVCRKERGDWYLNGNGGIWKSKVLICRLFFQVLCLCSFGTVKFQVSQRVVAPLVHIKGWRLLLRIDLFDRLWSINFPLLSCIHFDYFKNSLDR